MNIKGRLKRQMTEAANSQFDKIINAIAKKNLKFEHFRGMARYFVVKGGRMYNIIYSDGTTEAVKAETAADALKKAKLNYKVERIESPHTIRCVYKSGELELNNFLLSN